MPIRRRATGQRFGMFGTVRSFMSVIKEMSFDDVRDEAELAPRLLILAPDATASANLGRALVGDDAAVATIDRALDAVPNDLDLYDAVIVHDPANTGAQGALQRRMPDGDGKEPIFAFTGRGPDDSAAIEKLRTTLVTRLPERAPAFGRAFPALRSAAIKAVIDESAKANAQFALVSNIPAVVPLLGGLMAASADFLVLTKNQIMLLYKIAAIHGRDLHDQFGIIREMVPVVGAGMLWRTMAREAASFIPLAGGTIPKVVIAYAGTRSVGHGADFYYRFGQKPSKEQMRGFYEQAAEAVRRLPLPIPGGRDDQAPTEEFAVVPDQAMTDQNAARLD